MRNPNEQEILQSLRREYSTSSHDVDLLMNFLTTLVRNELHQEAIEVLDTCTQYFLDNNLATATFIKIRKEFAQILKVSFSHQDRKIRKIKAKMQVFQTFLDSQPGIDQIQTAAKTYHSFSVRIQKFLDNKLQSMSWNIANEGQFSSLKAFSEYFPNIPIDTKAVCRGLLRPFKSLLPTRKENDYWYKECIEKHKSEKKPYPTHPSSREEWEETLDELFTNYENDPLIASYIQYYEKNAFHQNPYRDAIPYRNQWGSELEAVINANFRSLETFDLYKALIFIEKATSGRKNLWQRNAWRKAQKYLTEEYIQIYQESYFRGQKEPISDECLQKMAILFPSFHEEYQEMKRKKKQQAKEKKLKQEKEWEKILQMIDEVSPESDKLDNTHEEFPNKRVIE
ncbi:MAG: hypothetical protein P1V18_05015 [Candidatus Gracilibacteria bacterium]|nr:hypothetical protein [Candidatus Gracilibacteria bacterium]